VITWQKLADICPTQNFNPRDGENIEDLGDAGKLKKYLFTS
jgi:hypothetical protein